MTIIGKKCQLISAVCLHFSKKNKTILYFVIAGIIPLEKADYVDACQNWPSDSDNANLGVAKDTRYENLAQFTTLPNEY